MKPHEPKYHDTLEGQLRDAQSLNQSLTQLLESVRHDLTEERVRTKRLEEALDYCGASAALVRAKGDKNPVLDLIIRKWRDANKDIGRRIVDVIGADDVTERLVDITTPIGNCDGSGRYAFDPEREDGRGAVLATPCSGCRACR